MKPLDMKDIAIIDALPVYDCRRTVLNVGCGPGRIDFHLAKMGYRVWGIDIMRYDEWEDSENLSFHIANIFDLSSMPIQRPDIIICSQVLEHLENYGMALVNMMALARIRIVLTTPYRNSFSHPEHLHFWDDKENGKFKDINEIKYICHPNSVSISKIKTKKKDAAKRKSNYLIIIDKRQNLMLEGTR